MQVMVTFRHLDASDNLRDYAESKLKRLDKYLDSAGEAHVVLSVEKFRHTADVTVSANGLRVKGVEETEDMYSALDLVTDSVEKQIRRQMDRRKGHKNRQGESIKALHYTLGVIEGGAGEETSESTFVETQRVQAKPMDVDEAIMQLDLTKSDFLVFTNAHSELINVVYRRQDGKICVIEPA